MKRVFSVVRSSSDYTHGWTCVFRHAKGVTHLVAIRFDNHPSVSVRTLQQVLQDDPGGRYLRGPWCKCIDIAYALRRRHLGGLLVNLMGGGGKVCTEMSDWFAAATARQTQRKEKKRHLRT